MTDRDPQLQLLKATGSETSLSASSFETGLPRGGVVTFPAQITHLAKLWLGAVSASGRKGNIFPNVGRYSSAMAQGSGLLLFQRETERGGGGEERQCEGGDRGTN
jgi:hypothetical protein